MTVRQRKDTGAWISDIFINGERIVTTLKLVQNEKEAKLAESAIMKDLFLQAYGLKPKPDKLFENFVIETFLPYSEANKKSFRSDVSICKVLVKAFKRKKLRQIDPPAVETFKQQFLAKPVEYGTGEDKKVRKRSLATVNNHLRVLSKILSLAVDGDLIQSNPCFRVRKFRPNNRRLRVLSVKEEGLLFKQLKDNELVRRIVLIALHTGLRRGEIFNLQWPDVDFGRNRLTIRKTKSSNERFVPMNATVRRVLLSTRQSDGYVFPSPRTGERLVDLKKCFRKAVDDAGIDNFRFHDLRHTFATRLADKGINIFDLQIILGHADIRTTVIYTHATSDAMREAVEKLNGKNHLRDVYATEAKTAGASQP